MLAYLFQHKIGMHLYAVDESQELNTIQYHFHISGYLPFHLDPFAHSNTIENDVTAAISSPEHPQVDMLCRAHFTTCFSVTHRSWTDTSKWYKGDED